MLRTGVVEFMRDAARFLKTEIIIYSKLLLAIEEYVKTFCNN